MSWSVPRLWAGRTVTVLAGGESMSKAVADAVLWHSRFLPRAIAINRTVELAPWASMVYAADAAFWKAYPKALETPGLHVGMEPHPGVLVLEKSFATKGDTVAGFDPDPSRLRTGGNSGYQALQIAVHAGATRVLLCGFDMKGGHWHEPYKAPLRETPQDLYPVWRARFDTLAPILKARGVDVVNCTPDSALECFRRQDLEEALAEGVERAAA